MVHHPIPPKNWTRKKEGVLYLWVKEAAERHQTLADILINLLPLWMYFVVIRS